MSRRAHQPLSLLLALSIAAPSALALVPKDAHAQAAAKGPSKKELDAARKNFMEGLDLEKAENWSEARKRFEEVAKVRMTPEVRFHIALCEEHEGLLLEAVRDFGVAESDAKAEGKTAVMNEAPEHANAIRPRIPKIKFKLPSDVPDAVSVTLDGNPIDPKGSEEQSLNPGTHKVEATADGFASFSYEFKLEESETKIVTLKMTSLKKDEPVPEPEPEPVKPETTKMVRKTPVLAYVALGVGVVSLAGSVLFFTKRNSVKNELDTDCPDLRCGPDKSDQISSGKTYTTLTNVFAIIGVVGVGTGIYLWAAAPKVAEETPAPATEAPKSANVQLVPGAPGANLGGLALQGAF